MTEYTSSTVHPTSDACTITIPLTSLLTAFAAVPDPRRKQGQR